nr:STM3941 family protein [uncultured Capnocytophaga sp.]
MKDTIIIPFSKKKMLKLTGFYALIILGVAGVTALILSADTLNLYYLAFFLVLLIVTIILFFMGIKGLLSLKRSKGGVILTPEYLKSNVNLVGKWVGEIPWNEIAAIGRMKFYGIHIHIKLKHPENYLSRIKSKEIRNRFEGIQIDNSELEITFEELERLINEFFAKYGNS